MVNRIDTDALKEANIRLGVGYTIVAQPPVEMNHYSAEHGRPPGEPSVLRPQAKFSGWHGEAYADHQNSVFNARTFFQAGPVKPSRRTHYGGRFLAAAEPLGALTGSFDQRKVRGFVNGNVLVPLAEERTPRTTDPALRALIERFLAAYPPELPNRADFDERALNTNAPQRIDELDGALRLDRRLNAQWRLFASHAIGRQRVDAFQLVAGQNPDMDIHTQRSRLTLNYAPSSAAEWSFGAGYTRTRSDLRPEPNAVGPRVRMGYQIEELGPDSHFPINRAENTHRYGFLGRRRAAGSAHALTFGADVARYQLNGVETNNSRGLIWFTSNFGRTAIENLLHGTATTYEVLLGDLARGFRNWNGNAFFADQWRIRQAFQLYFGLRYNFESGPKEVNRLNTLPYGCDCNNFSPRFHVAWNLPHDWILRTGYTVSFDRIPPVSYQQVRYNPPHARYIQVQNPDVLDPLRGIDVKDAQTPSSPTYFSADLVSPYAHQYHLLLEKRIKGLQLRTGYLGSRTFKLINSFIENRAEPVASVPLTTATVQQRRPDPRFNEIKRIVNGGIAYLDAAQAVVELPRWRGLNFGVSYTFSKAIDEGADFTSTAANRDLARGRAQAQYETFKDLKGLSSFDSTHALLVYQNWDLPRPAVAFSWLRWAFSGWQISNAALLKTGTPFTLYVGSDAPGFGNVDGGPSDRPNILDPSILGMTISHPDVAPLILRRDRFAFIRPGERRGSLGRNTFRRAPIANWNGALTRRWRIGGASERWVQLRAEAINLANHPQFDEPNRNLNATAFGKITNTLNDGRVFQFGLRFIL